MAYEHDAYCDHDHSPRQRCNEALAPRDLAIGPVADEIPPHLIEHAGDAELAAASVAVRETVATGGAPPVSPYLLRETQPWSSSGEPQIDDVEIAPPRSLIARSMILIGLLLLTLLFLRRRRRDTDG